MFFVHICICQLSNCGGRNLHFNVESSEDSSVVAANDDGDNRQLNVGSESSYGQCIVKVLTL